VGDIVPEKTKNYDEYLPSFLLKYISYEKKAMFAPLNHQLMFSPVGLGISAPVFMVVVLDIRFTSRGIGSGLNKDSLSLSNIGVELVGLYSALSHGGFSSLNSLVGEVGFLCFDWSTVYSWRLNVLGVDDWLAVNLLIDYLGRWINVCGVDDWGRLNVFDTFNGSWSSVNRVGSNCLDINFFFLYQWFSLHLLSFFSFLCSRSKR